MAPQTYRNAISLISEATLPSGNLPSSPFVV